MESTDTPTLTSTGARLAAAPQRAARRPRAFTGGGPDGNEQLTAMTGTVLIILLAVLGVTILRIGQLISVHMFVGLLLLGPVAVKLGSTGYRFTRYYTGSREYRRKGPPVPLMRGIAPVVILTTAAVFATGLVLLFAGPANRGNWVELHKLSFIVWLGFMAIHVLGHLPGLPASLRAGRSKYGRTTRSPGDAGRWITLAGGLVGGLVLAIVLLPQFAQWTASGAFGFH